MTACLYTGWVSHLRLRPRRHGFDYWICMAMVNLEELEGSAGGTLLPSGFWRALLPLRRRDHLKTLGQGSDGGQNEASLRQRLAVLVRGKTGIDLDGEVLLLTGFGFLWHRFNPVSFYYCFDRGGLLQCLVAEVTNTPWKEQFHYVLDARAQQGKDVLVFDCDKDFHVSPFMPMDTRYHWRVTVPGPELAINIGVEKDSAPLFSAHLDLQRRPLTASNLLGCLWRQPLMSLQVVLRIYWQALLLWLKNTPFHTHPDRANRNPSPTGDRP